MSWWIVVPAALVVALIAMEVAGRMHRRHVRYCVWEPGLTRRISPDPATHPQLEPRLLFANNRDGERGDEVPDLPGTFRILVAGGSAAECFLLDQATQWPGALQALLRRPEALGRLGAQQVHVGNVGRSLVASETVLMILQRLLPQYAALDAVILMVGASDILTWLELGAPPDRTGEPKAVTQVFSRHPEVQFGWSPRQLALTLLLQEYLAPRIEDMPNAAKWMGRARAMRSAARTVIDEVPDPAHVLEHFERNLRSIVAVCFGHAHRVLVVGQPWLELSSYTPELEALFWNGGVGQAHRETISVYYSSRVVSRLMRVLHERARRVTADAGAEFVDVMSTFEPSASNFIDQFHFTPRGSGLVAAAVREQVLGA
jgi:lysophospholipase L1-like esterase